MKNISLAVLLFAVSGLAYAGDIEKLSSIPLKDINSASLKDAGIDIPAPKDAVESKTAPAQITKAKSVTKTSTYVQVSGYVTLNGNGSIMMPNGGFTTIYLNGWVTVRDSSGQITSNNSYVNIPVSMFIYPNQFVSQFVYPNISAQLYKNGKYVGSTTLNGSINVTGFPSGSFVSLSGSGNISGSVYVDDAQ